jgi:hypothetical protein
LVVLTAVCGNDLEHRFDVAAVVACSAIVTGALLVIGIGIDVALLVIAVARPEWADRLVG